MSIFRRKKSSAGLGSSTASLTSNSTSPPLPPKRRESVNTLAGANPSDSPRVYVDDFGRPVGGDRVAFGQEQAGSSFGNGYGIGDDDVPTELRLLYGYTPIETTLELSISRVAEIVARSAHELGTRGLDTPLILSSMSLDLSLEGTVSLIRSYLVDQATWAYDLQLAAPLSVGSFMKWGLGRLINDRGGRGFVSWDLYNDFKHAEKAASFPSKFSSTNLLARLPSPSAHLLGTLLSLFSSIAAHSKANGMTPRKLASLFSPYIFGLADDETFDATYVNWQRGTDATEHIILAFIRDQQADGPLPTYLEKFILGYPTILNVSYGSAAPRVPKGSRTEEVTRVRRLTRFHSPNLIRSAGLWEVPHSSDWSLFFPNSASASALATLSTNGSSSLQTVYSAPYRHLLNIRSNTMDDDDDEGELQRFKSVTEKSWSKFGELGFKDVESSKLEFDLTEGERNKVKEKHETMDWGTFETAGFGRETFGPSDLIFHQSVHAQVSAGRATRAALDSKLRATEKFLPSFPYDTTPHEEGRVLVDSLFFEAYADLLVGGGWCRDELKESSFALIQWRSRPREGELPKGRTTANGDDRTEDRWVLVEEFVPKEYRDELTEGKKKANKRISFMRAVRRKSTTKSPPLPSARQITHPHHSGNGSTIVTSIPYNSTLPRTSTREIDTSVFAPGPGNTKVLSLSNLNLAAGPASAYAPSYAPSVVSTTGAGHGHNDSILELDETSTAAPSEHTVTAGEPTFLGNGVGGTLSSQRRESAFNGDRAPVGYSKPPPAPRGFLARLGSRKTKQELAPVLPSPETSPGSRSDASFPELHEAPPAIMMSNGAPHLGAVVEAPASPSPQPTSTTAPPRPTSELAPPPPPKSNRGSAYATATEGGTPLSDRSSMITNSEEYDDDDDDPYGGIDDDEDDTEVGQVLFRGSQSFSGPSIQIAAPASPPRRVAIPQVVSRTEPKPDTEILLDDDFPHRNDKFLSGASEYSTRVKSIVGLYESRESSPVLEQGH